MLCSTIGRSFDLIENRKECLKASQIALYLDPRCLDAAAYLIDRGIISVQERRTLFAGISAIETNTAILNLLRSINVYMGS